MKINVLGVGAAGNKALALLINQGLIERERGLFVNSTMGDIPQEFRQNSLQLSDEISGCGKERNLAIKLVQGSILVGRLNMLYDAIDEDCQLVVIIGSTEGGTGSGALPPLMTFIEDNLGVPTIAMAITGFEDDIKGARNTLAFFEDLGKIETAKYQIIRNKDFLDASKNTIKAESEANEEIARRIKVLSRFGRVDGTQNIDESDNEKLISTPGFMMTGYRELDGKLKSKDVFNSILTDLFEDNKSVSTLSKTASRIGVFINLDERSLSNIDFDFSVLKDYLGKPYEFFKHFQFNSEVELNIGYIAAGMDVPLDEFRTVYERFEKEAKVVSEREQVTAKSLNFGVSDSADPNDMLSFSKKRRRRNPEEVINAAKGVVTESKTFTNTNINKEATAKINNEISKLNKY